jgi:hypothetical protein
LTHIIAGIPSIMERSEELQQVIDVVYFAPNIIQGRFTPAPADERI